MVARQAKKEATALRKLQKAEAAKYGPAYYTDAELGAKVVRLRTAVPYDRRAHGAAVLEAIRKLNRKRLLTGRWVCAT